MVEAWFRLKMVKVQDSYEDVRRPQFGDADVRVKAYPIGEGYSPRYVGKVEGEASEVDKVAKMGGNKRLDSVPTNMIHNAVKVDFNDMSIDEVFSMG